MNLDPPPPSHPWAASNLDQVEVDYGPALPSHLDADLHVTSDQPSSPAEELSKKASVRPKTQSYSYKKSASDQLMSPMNLRLHLLDPKNMLTRGNIRLDPDTCHLPQRRISFL